MLTVLQTCVSAQMKEIIRLKFNYISSIGFIVTKVEGLKPTVISYFVGTLELIVFSEDSMESLTQHPTTTGNVDSFFSNHK